MDLLERYLSAIRLQLDPKMAGDIIAELRDVLLHLILCDTHYVTHPM